MGNTSHTPAPWVCRKEGKWITDDAWECDAPESPATSRVDVLNSEGEAICLVVERGNTIGEPNQDANAHLIAAAPELLELTILLAKTLRYQIKCYELKGDTEGASLNRFTLLGVDAAIAKARGES